MIKIVNKNKYEKMIDRLNELEMEKYKLGKDIDELNNELLQTTNENVYLGTQIDDLKKIRRKLRTLCTKNKIDYSKIFEQGEK